MASQQPDKPTSKKPSRHFSSRVWDLFILICGLILGGSLDLFINQHGRTIGNYWYSIGDNWIHHRCCLYQLSKYNLDAYWQMSKPGAIVELIIIAILLIILGVIFYFRRGNDITDKIEQNRKDLVDAINNLGDRLDKKLDGLGKIIGDRNTTEESETSKERTNKTRGKRKIGKRKGKQ